MTHRTAFAEAYGFGFNSPHLALALVHRSAVSGSRNSNERLEFLGDALVSAYVARFLFNALPDFDEGTLSRSRAFVVRRETLAQAARQIGLQDILDVAAGERKVNRHQADAPLADAYEAVVGALFLENGDAAAERFVRDTLADALSAAIAEPTAPDAKTQLQILLQGMGRGLPIYKDVPSGKKTVFACEVWTIAGDVLGRGSGSNKRIAQTIAAQQAITELEARDKANEFGI